MLSVGEDVEKLEFFLGQNGEKDHEDTARGDRHCSLLCDNFMVAYICQNLNLCFKYVFICYTQ